MDGIVMSGEERVTKPDAKIYHILLNRYQLAPEECVFFDDNLNNVIAAQNIGIHAVQFQSMEQAKCELPKITLS
jgi:HAD superfamily hydrolase (TIGR01509 family)